MDKKTLIKKAVTRDGETRYLVYLDPHCTEIFEARSAAKRFVKKNFREIVARRAAYDY